MISMAAQINDFEQYIHTGTLKLPVKYHKSKAQWFGMEAFYGTQVIIFCFKDGTIESKILVHVFRPTSQDSGIIEAIIKHCGQACEKDMSSLEEVFYLSYNMLTPTTVPQLFKQF